MLCCLCVFWASEKVAWCCSRNGAAVEVCILTAACVCQGTICAARRRWRRRRRRPWRWARWRWSTPQSRRRRRRRRQWGRPRWSSRGSCRRRHRRRGGASTKTCDPVFCTVSVTCWKCACFSFLYPCELQYDVLASCDGWWCLEVGRWIGVGRIRLQYFGLQSAKASIIKMMRNKRTV